MMRWTYVCQLAGLLATQIQLLPLKSNAQRLLLQATVTLPLWWLASAFAAAIRSRSQIDTLALRSRTTVQGAFQIPEKPVLAMLYMLSRQRRSVLRLICHAPCGKQPLSSVLLRKHRLPQSAFLVRPRQVLSNLGRVLAKNMLNSPPGSRRGA